MKTLLPQLFKYLLQLMNGWSLFNSVIKEDQWYTARNDFFHHQPSCTMIWERKEREYYFIQIWDQRNSLFSCCDWIIKRIIQFDVNFLCISWVDIGTQRKVNQLFLFTLLCINSGTWVATNLPEYLQTYSMTSRSSDICEWFAFQSSSV